MLWHPTSPSNRISGSHEDVLSLAEGIQFTPSPMNYIEVSLSKSWSLLRKTANQGYLDTTDIHLKLDYPSLGLPVKATSWRFIQLQLLGINWIRQKTQGTLIQCIFLLHYTLILLLQEGQYTEYIGLQEEIIKVWHFL